MPGLQIDVELHLVSIEYIFPHYAKDRLGHLLNARSESDPPAFGRLKDSLEQGQNSPFTHR